MLPKAPPEVGCSWCVLHSIAPDRQEPVRALAVSR
jgi:hypothetical protein